MQRGRPRAGKEPPSVYDVLLGRAVTECEATRGLAAAFGVAAGETAVVREPAALGAAIVPATRVLGVLSPVAGGFPLRLTIVMRDAALECRMRRADPVAIFGRFCAEIGVVCLVGAVGATSCAGWGDHGVSSRLEAGESPA